MHDFIQLSHLQYQLNSLKDLCDASLSQNITTESAMKLLLLADMYNANLLKSSCLLFISCHPTEVNLADWKSLTANARPELTFELWQMMAANRKK